MKCLPNQILNLFIHACIVSYFLFQTELFITEFVPLSEEYEIPCAKPVTPMNPNFLFFFVIFFRRLNWKLKQSWYILQFCLDVYVASFNHATMLRSRKHPNTLHSPSSISANILRKLQDADVRPISEKKIQMT